MKKLVIFLLFVLLPCTSFAVVYDFHLSPAYPIGSLGDDFSRGVSLGTDFFFWSPEWGQGGTIGARFAVSRFGTEDRDDIDSGRTYVFEFIPSIRYYPLNTGILQFFWQAGIGYFARDTNLEGDFTTVDETHTGLGLSLGAGISLGIGGVRRIILLPMLNLAGDSSFFNINIGLLFDTNPPEKGKDEQKEDEEEKEQIEEFVNVEKILKHWR